MEKPEKPKTANQAEIMAHIEQIKAMAPTMSKVAVAHHFGWNTSQFNVNTNKPWFKELGIAFLDTNRAKSPLSDAEVRASFVAAFQSSKSNAQIARENNMAPSTVSHYKIKLGLAPNRKIMQRRPTGFAAHVKTVAQIESARAAQALRDSLEQARQSELRNTCGDTDALLAYRAKHGPKAPKPWTLADLQAMYREAVKTAPKRDSLYAAATPSAKPKGAALRPLSLA